MAVNKNYKITLLAVLTLFFFGIVFGVQASVLNNKLLSEGVDSLTLRIQLYIDDVEVPLPKDMLEDLAQVPFFELDNTIIIYMMNMGAYQDVEIKKGMDKDSNVVFLVYASSIKRVQNIYIRGVTSVEQNDIELLLSVRRGQPYKQEYLNKDNEKIENYLISKGYPNAKIESSIATELSKEGVQIEISIDKGNPCRIDQVLTKDQISNILNFLTLPIETGKICDIQKINESLENLKESYLEQGYLEAKVKMQEIQYSENKESAKIILQIEKGKRTIFQIFDQDSEILNTDFLVERHGLTNSDILLLSDAELLVILTNFYKRQGYAFVNIVGPDRIIDKEGNTILKFLMKRGTLIQIGKISFLGKLPESEDVAIEQMGLKRNIFSGGIPFFQDNLEQYRDKLKSYLLKLGYFDARVAVPDFIPSSDGQDMNLVFRVDKGYKYLVSSVKYTGFPISFQFDIKRLEEILSPEKPYSVYTNQQFQDELRKQFLYQGYLYSQYRIELKLAPEVKSEVKYVNVNVEANAGQIVRIRKIYVDVDLIGKEKMIISQSGLNSGDIFDLEKLESARQSLMKHDLFSNVSIEPLDFSAIDRKENRLDVIIHARSKSGFSLGLSPGYGTFKGYSFGADFTLNKLNTDGLKFFSSASVSQEKQQQSFASSDTRQILGRQLSLGLSESLFKMGSLVTPFDVSAILGYQVAAETLTNREYKTFKGIVDWKPSYFNLNWSLSQSFFHEDSNSTSSESAIVQIIDSPSIVSREMTTSLSLDTRNNAAWPTSGGYHNIQVSFARFGVGSEVKYNRYSGFTDHFFPIYKNLSGALTFGGYFITDTVNSNGQTITPPASKRATLTENALVRGFPETYGSTAPGPLLWIHYANNGVSNCSTQLASLGATNLLYLKYETRYRFSEVLGGVLFLDSAANYFTQQEVNQVNAQITNRINSLQPSSTACVPDNAILIAPNPVSLQELSFFEQYWSEAYISAGIGLRLILGNYATMSLDYGYPLKDPSSLKSNCMSPSEALNSNTPPQCVTRIQDSSFLGLFKYRGALHFKIGAQF